MARYIDAFALSDAVLKSKKDNPHTDGIVRKIHNHEHEHFLCMIATTPTEDVVPVVRCKDCKHCDPYNKHCDHVMGTSLPIAREPDDFCSYGERKVDNGKL